MDLSPGTTSCPAVMGRSHTRWWLQLGALCRAHSFCPSPGLSTLQLSGHTSCLPQVKKSGYSRAMIGFGFVSRRTDPLKMCSLCCLCRLLPSALPPTTAVLKRSQLGNAELPPSAAPCAVLRSTSDFMLSFYKSLCFFFSVTRFLLPPLV